MAGLVEFLKNQPKWAVIMIGFLLVALIGFIDYLTGDYSILVFYLLPVSLVSWYAGRSAGAATAVASGLARFFSDYSLDIPLHHLYWNSTQDMIFLLIVSFLISLLRKSLRIEDHTGP